jgi:hypothetical protein
MNQQVRLQYKEHYLCFKTATHAYTTERNESLKYTKENYANFSTGTEAFALLLVSKWR